MINIQEAEGKRIAGDLNRNIHNFLDRIKGHMAIVEEEIKLLEKINLSNQMDLLIDDAFQQMINLKSNTRNSD